MKIGSQNDQWYLSLQKDYLELSQAYYVKYVFYHNTLNYEKGTLLKKVLRRYTIRKLDYVLLELAGKNTSCNHTFKSKRHHK